jgi:hypothetical protein
LRDLHDERLVIDDEHPGGGLGHGAMVSDPESEVHAKRGYLL